jgi:hypothetical protein
MEERIRMRSSTLKTVFAGLTLVLSAITLSAQAGSTNVPNWTVPPYRAQSSSGGLQTMADISDAAIFVAVTTCRVFDTRDPVGLYGGPRLIANTTRNFDIDNGPCTGIPAGSAAFSMNFGSILPDGDGFVTIWPAGAAQPTSSFMNTQVGEVVANAAIVPASSGGVISIFPNTGMHMYGDINGYFMDAGGDLNDNVTLIVDASDPGEPSIYGLNRDTTSTSSFVNGVRGYINTLQSGPSAVYGFSDGASGNNYGVTGESDSTSTGAAGVRGLSGAFTVGNVNPLTEFREAAMVAIGGNGSNGLNAFSQGGTSAVRCKGTDTSGNEVSSTYMCFNEFGAFSIWADDGVLIGGDLIVSGTKSFVQPHATDASKQIRYISVEAPSADIYFRGTAQVSRGVTRIDVPEYFRLVAAPGTYATIVTPVGGMATVAVMREDEGGIVLQASRDVKVHYVVHATRDGWQDFNPIEANIAFRPMHEGSFDRQLHPRHREIMIRNGTLNADGTANLETAGARAWTLRPDPDKVNQSSE